MPDSQGCEIIYSNYLSKSFRFCEAKSDSSELGCLKPEARVAYASSGELLLYNISNLDAYRLYLRSSTAHLITNHNLVRFFLHHSSRPFLPRTERIYRSTCIEMVASLTCVIICCPICLHLPPLVMPYLKGPSADTPKEFITPHVFTTSLIIVIFVLALT